MRYPSSHNRTSPLWLMTCALAPWTLAALATAASPPWDELRANYEYDASAPLDVWEQSATEAPTHVLHRLTFASPRGGRVPVLFAVPRQGRAPYPVLMLLHGYGGSKDDWIPLIGAICNGGRAVIAIDAVYHGDRAREGEDILSADWTSNRAAFIQTIVDLRRAVDYLATRDDVDADRIGLLGASMGAIMGTIVAAVEPRIKCAVLAVGGGNWRVLVEKTSLGAVAARREQLLTQWENIEGPLAAIEPLYFAPHIAPRPVLMLNGKRDGIVVPECSQALYDALGEPKQIIWFDSGHGLPVLEAWATAAQWLDKHL